MAVVPGRGRITGLQRAVLATAGMVAVIVASTMFLSVTALTRDGADYECGPAAFALVAGPSRRTASEADCGRAAAQRLTAVVGLSSLAVVAGLAGSWLLAVPEGGADGPRARSDTDHPPDSAPRAGRARGNRPYADGRV